MKQHTLRAWTKTLFAVYILLLMWLVLFKLGFQIPHRPRGINLIPFYTEHVGSLLWDIALNILAFLPLGLYMRMLRASALTVTLAGLSLSFAFELTQFAFAMGTADITDLLTNTAGAVCGVGLYALLVRLVGHTERVHRILLVIGGVGTVLAVVYFLMMMIATVSLMGLLGIYLRSAYHCTEVFLPWLPI